MAANGANTIAICQALLARVPSRTALAGLALILVLAMQPRPALPGNTAASLGSLTPERAFARLGAAVLPLVYRVEPDEEPLLPEAAPPEEITTASFHPRSACLHLDIVTVTA